MPTSSHVLIERLRSMLELPAVGTGVLTRVVGESLMLRWTGASVVVAPGDPVDALYVVMFGAVEVLDGDVLIDELDPGATFGGREAVLGVPYEYRYVAAPECELLVIPRSPLSVLLEASPELADRLAGGD